MLKMNLYTFRGSNSFILISVFLLSRSQFFNPVALRMAKTLWSFDHSECKRVKERTLLDHPFVKLTENHEGVLMSPG